MATIYKRTSKHGTLKYYGNLSINKKRGSRFLEKIESENSSYKEFTMSILTDMKR